MIVERNRGLSFTVLSDAGALPDGVLEVIQEAVKKGLARYLRDVKAGMYKASSEGTFISVEELLSAQYNPRVVPFIPKRFRPK